MRNYIYIHSKFYDLDKIKKEHPGGCLKIFNCLENVEDCTPLFESSHAMKDVTTIYELMKAFEIQEKDYPKFNITSDLLNSKKLLKKFNFTTYHKISDLVRKELKRKYKVNTLWYFKVIFLFILYIYFFVHGLILNEFCNYLKYLCAFVSGWLWVCIGFCTMHDGSHYGLFNTKSKNIILNNDVISSIWHGWGLWNSYIWFKHHTYGHHSFTGMFGKDPDVIHGRPLFRKNRSDTKIIKFLGQIQDKVILIFLFLPGTYVAQILAYFVGMLRGHIWKVGIKHAFKHTPIYEKILYFISLSILIFNSNYFTVFFYLTAANINYAICIVPDHDTFESTIENDTDTDDWAEMQIRKAANFSHNSTIFTELNGGINLQIEHHLFPTVAHSHYEKVFPIVKSYCEKNGIPYVQKNNLFEVFQSYRKMLNYTKVK